MDTYTHKSHRYRKPSRTIKRFKLIIILVETICLSRVDEVTLTITTKIKQIKSISHNQSFKMLKALPLKAEATIEFSFVNFIKKVSFVDCSK